MAQVSAAADRWLARQFASRDRAFPGIVGRVAAKPERIPWLISGFVSADPAVKFGCAKTLKLLAGAEPRLVYPHFDFLVAQLENANRVLRWNAAAALACLAPVDRANKLESVLDRYLSAIDGPEMIMAATVIHGAARIARGKPRLAGRAIAGILRVSAARYGTAECRHVAIGHAIQALDGCLDVAADKAAVLAFVKAQLDNPRLATRKKAHAFLRKYADRPAALSRGTTPTTRRRASP